MPGRCPWACGTILRIVCKNTDALAGYLYLWNTGELQPAWLGDAMTEVRYAHLSQAAC